MNNVYTRLGIQMRLPPEPVHDLKVARGKHENEEKRDED
jgi:hypothetical protein